MKNFVHIIHSDFSRKVFGHDTDWFEHRLKILENFTLKSLENQTNKDFYYVMYLRKCFPESLLPKLDKILERSSLRSFIIHYDVDNDLREKITNNLPKVDYIYATRIDSDDLFHKDAVKEIQSYEFSPRRALIYQEGYCYDCVNKKMRHHLMPCPPFHTIMYPYDIYLDLESAAKYRSSTGGHDTVISAMNSIILSEGKYIVLFHGQNNRSRYTERAEHAFRTVPSEEHYNILKDFGIDENTYSKI